MSVTCVSLSCLSHLIRLRGLVNFERSHEKCLNVELGPFGFDWSRPEGVWHSHRSALSHICSHVLFARLCHIEHFRQVPLASYATRVIHTPSSSLLAPATPWYHSSSHSTRTRVPSNWGLGIAGSQRCSKHFEPLRIAIEGQLFMLFSWVRQLWCPPFWCPQPGEPSALALWD